MTTLTADVSPADFAAFRVHSTRWMDDDVYGHLNNVVYYSLFDSAVNGWLIEATGVDIRTLPAIGVVAETACRYFSETAFPDVLQIGIGVEHRGRSSVIYRLAAFREEDGGQLGPDALGGVPLRSCVRRQGVAASGADPGSGRQGARHARRGRNRWS